MGKNTIGYRIEILIKELGLSKGEFAKQADISQSLISNITSGNNGPSRATLNLICNTYHVNKDWLRTGEGAMFMSPSATEKEEIPGAKDLLDTYRDLIDINRKLVVNHAHYLLETQGGAREENGKAAAPQAIDEKGKKANDRRADVSRSASSE